MSVMRKLTSYTKKIPIQELYDMYKSGEIETDLAFQANEFTRWSKENISSWPTSIFTNMNPSAILLVDIEECLNYAIENSLRQDIEYFQKWYDAGVKKLIIDGNNRIKNSVSFIDGEYYTEKMQFRDDFQFYKIGESKFSELPVLLQETFLESEINVETYTDVSREELSELFSRVNDGKPLNDPEKRNASTSNIASVIRDLALKYKPIYYNKNVDWFKLHEVNRRQIDDFIAGCAFYYFEGLEKAITPQSLKKMYRVDSSADQGAKSFKNTFESFMKIFSDSRLNSLSNRNMLFDLFVLYIQNREERKELIEEKKSDFITDFINTSAKLLSDETLYKISKKSDPKSFYTMIGGRQAQNNIFRNYLFRQNMDMSEYFRPKARSRTASKTTKFIAAIRDDLKTPEGKDIDLSKLHNGNVYHGGHIVPAADGGDANLDNIVIQEKSDNLALGRKVVDIDNNLK